MVVKYTARKEFLYDPDLNALADVKIALGIFDEYCRRYGARPPVRFLEANRKVEDIDPIWHVPKNNRTQYDRTLDIPAINQFQKPNWKLTKLGITYQRRDQFWLSNLSLQKFDYFPLRGDAAYWSGYRYMIIDVVLPPDAYWGQTQAWTGLVVDCVVPADGDAIPTFPRDQLQPAERAP